MNPLPPWLLGDSVLWTDDDQRAIDMSLDAAPAKLRRRIKVEDQPQLSAPPSSSKAQLTAKIATPASKVRFVLFCFVLFFFVVFLFLFFLFFFFSSFFFFFLFYS